MGLIGLTLALLPGFAWLFFFLQEDLHPEPKKLIAITFAVGALSAVVALGLEVIFNSTFFINIGVGKLTIIVLLVLAFIEELVKFIAAYLCTYKNPAFNEPVDAMIYMVVAALGFATLENVGAIGGGTTQTYFLSAIFATASLRFIGATLLHSLTSALVGYYWAIGIRELSPRKYIILGLVLATVLHGIFNYFIISYGNIAITVVFLSTVGFFVLNDFERLKQRFI